MANMFIYIYIGSIYIYSLDTMFIPRMIDDNLKIS